MSFKFVQPIDGSAAFIEDEKGRRINFPSPSSLDTVVGSEKVFGANGEYLEYGVLSEEITLATGGLTTDSTANLLPANSELLAVVGRITQAITATTNWALGDGTTVARFTAANATLTLGTTVVGLECRQPAATNAAGPVQAAAAKLRVTCTGANPGAGKIRVSVFYRQFVAPTS